VGRVMAHYAILGQQHRLITHLVTDSRCAREML
jgi:hypothetical protein